MAVINCILICFHLQLSNRVYVKRKHAITPANFHS